ncbi:MAG: GspE/PulE family protein, partial [Gaiellaceae bacterium]
MEAAHDFPTRLPPDSNGTPVRAQLGALLVRDALIDAEQLEQALAEKEVTGRRLGEIVVGHGWVPPATVARLLAEQHGLSYLDLALVTPDPDVGRLLPERYARGYEALPVQFLDETTVLVAVADPTNVVASDGLRAALGLDVRFAVASAPELQNALARAYAAEAKARSEAQYGPEDLRTNGAASAPAISLVNSLLTRAIEAHASDVHFEPQADEMVVRARVDGVMRRLGEVDHDLQPSVTSRLKIMAELDIAEKRAPQDGRVSVHYGGRPMDLRLAILPTTHGEQIVVRLMNRPGGRLGLEELGMSPHASEAFSRAIRQPHGAVIACGPTGSGKTTTLYAAL